MKCEHLIKIPSSVRWLDIEAMGLKHPIKDMLVCIGKHECPKKKQPCEINRRCWEMKR